MFESYTIKRSFSIDCFPCLLIISLRYLQYFWILTSQQHNRDNEPANAKGHIDTVPDQQLRRIEDCANGLKDCRIVVLIRIGGHFAIAMEVDIEENGLQIRAISHVISNIYMTCVGNNGRYRQADPDDSLHL